jgi:Ni,Fe-hydrogenase III component G
MSKENQIIEQMLVRFPFMENKLFSPRSGRIISPSLQRNHFEDAFEFATTKLGFDTLHQLIGVDDGDNLGFIYMLCNADKVVLLLKLSVPKANPVLDSVCSRFANALLYEQELVNLWGAVISDLPENSGYPLPDNWPAGSYPLRKEWKTEYFNQKKMAYNPTSKTIRGG